MAESQVTQTGVEEMRALARSLPDRVNALGLRRATSTANAIVVEARRRLQQPTPATKGERHVTGATAALIEVRADAANKQVLVHSQSPSKYPANLVLWREYGTSRMPARPYMGPAARTQAQPYAQGLQDDMDRLAQELSS
jgi:hypothetical protein